jgi:hypothetical protein
LGGPPPTVQSNSVESLAVGRATSIYCILT